jgi:MFS family permease
MRGVTTSDVREAQRDRVGPGFVARYALAYMSISLMLIAPLLVTLALKVRSLVGEDQAPGNLALVTGIGGLLSLFGNPVFGRLSDRTTSRFGMRRPWMLAGLLGGCLGTLLVAVAGSIPLVLVGWCLTQLSFSALQAALVAVLPDQVPVTQRGMVSGVLGVCVPTASVAGTFIVQLFEGHQVAMFLAPCLIGACFVVLFVVPLQDRRLAPDRRPRWTSRELLGAFAFHPRRDPDFAWAFVGRFLFISAFAFLTTYQAYYLIDRVGTAEADVPHQIFVATLVQSGVLVVASLLGGRLSDLTGRRKVFVAAASTVYGLALFGVAVADSFDGFLLGMAVSGLGFGIYMAVDLALVTDVLPDPDHAAKDLGVFNIANALPYAVAPAVAPAILAASDGSYAVLYAVAGACAVLGALAVVPIKGVR